MKLACCISILMFSVSPSWASQLKDIEYYLYKSNLKLAFGTSEPIHAPHFDFQDRIFAQALKKGVSGLRPASVVIIPMLGYRIESQDTLIADILLHPAMEVERNTIIAQFDLLERIAQAQEMNIEDLGTEQILQLINHFMILAPDQDFQFLDFSNAEELRGKVTKRNSLLRYHSYFVQYLFGRRLMTFERTEGENWAYLLPGILSFEPIVDSPKVKHELDAWLRELRSAPSEYDLMTDPAFERKLSVEARAMLTLATDAFLEVNRRESAKVIQRFRANQDITSAYEGMRRAAANAYHHSEVAESPSKFRSPESREPKSDPNLRPLRQMKELSQTRVYRFCENLLSKLKRSLN